MKTLLFTVCVVLLYVSPGLCGSMATIEGFEHHKIGIGVFAYDHPDEILGRSLRTGIIPSTFYVAFNQFGIEEDPPIVHRGLLGVIYQDEWFTIDTEFGRNWLWTGVESREAFIEYRDTVLNPEPSTWLLMLSGMGALWLWRNCQQRVLNAEIRRRHSV